MTKFKDVSMGGEHNFLFLLNINWLYSSFIMKVKTIVKT